MENLDQEVKLELPVPQVLVVSEEKLELLVAQVLPDLLDLLDNVVSVENQDLLDKEEREEKLDLQVSHSAQLFRLCDICFRKHNFQMYDHYDITL